MKKLKGIITILILLTFNALNITSCGRTQDTVSCFPNTVINVTLNLNLPAYYNLQNTGGWIYVNEQSSGPRGLIVVRTATGFKVYDRNAPHICPDNNTTLNVVNDVKIVCPKDNAEWILLTGQPTSVAQVPPKTYPYNYNSATNTLSIYN
jgi:nitrite reductase/ring-hydroxylating ferredoxin subunit